MALSPEVRRGPFLSALRWLLLVGAAGGLALSLTAFPGAPASGSGRADLAVTLADSPDPVAVGARLTYTAVVRNNGPSAATGVRVVWYMTRLPADASGRPASPDLVSARASRGSCSRNSSGSGVLASCTLGTLAAGGTASAAFTVVPRVPARREQFGALAEVSAGATPDPNRRNNQATELTAVGGGAAQPPIPAPPPPPRGGGNPPPVPPPPARGRGVLLGVLGDPARFASLTGQRSRIRLLIVGWGQGAGYGSSFAGLFATMAELPMLGLNTENPGGTEVISPGQIASGSGDGYLIALNRAIADFGRPLYIRPFAEMNAHWNPYCAFNSNGSPRDVAHSTAAFRKAFARVYLIVHGGPQVNARLARLGMPPVRAELAANPLVRVVWNPQGYGNPDTAANSAQAYYPGDAYVDVVGDDLYDIRFKAEWEAAEALYRAHPGKPFAFPEWGLWGIDDPAFVSRMATFVRTHPRTELVNYYSGRPGSIFDLGSKPRSRAAYRSLIVPLGR